MPFNFDTKKTSVARALGISSFPLFQYAGFLSQLFFYLFLISLALIPFSLLGFFLWATAIQVPLILLCVFLIFLEIDLFVKLKIVKLSRQSQQKPHVELLLSDALANPKEYNLAEFLSLESCKITEAAMKVSKKSRLLEVGSASVLYAALQESKDIKLLMWRLGIDPKKFQADVKNYLEKLERQKGGVPVLGKSFESVMLEAAKVAVERGRQEIGEKEILVALATHDEYFKKALVEQSLKTKDIENITLWLDVIEQRQERRRQFWTKENLSRHGSMGRDWATGFTVNLDQFSVDLRRLAQKHAFGQIIGHQKEIEDVENALVKTSASNVLLLGDPGVGRKSIVHELAERCYEAVGLPELGGKRVVELDMVAIAARIQNPETLEVTLDEIFQEVITAGNVILVVDNFDNFVEQKIQKPGTVDISGILGKYLPLPNFHFIGITSFDGLHRHLEQNPAFLEYFRKVEVSELSEADTINILQNQALALEQKHKVLVVYPAIREIVNLTGRYFPNAPFPKKAIDVLEEAVLYVTSQKQKVVEPSHVAKIVSDKTQIPVGKMDFKEKQVLLNLEQLIHERIINQKEAVDEISIAMRRARSGISSKKRPMGTFLFLGPTGVGKTETAKALAQIYFNGEDKMIRLDMSEFQSISDIPRLLGAISPVEQQGLLTTPVREKPFSLVLLDEIEKAHPNILNLLLQVLDEGHITDGQGRKVMFTNTIIICTSNAGAQMIFESAESGEGIDKDKLLASLFEQKLFKPEFVNRFDATVIFHPLSPENLMDIAQLALASLAKSLKEKDIDMTITEALKKKIVELSYKPEFGAREMRRVMQDTIENNIAQALLSDTITKGDKIEINPENFEIIKLS